jgi:multidrug efflux system membrane fusion protein
MKRSRAIICGAAVAAVAGISVYLGSGIISYPSDAQPVAVQPAPVPVTTVTVKRQDVPEFIEGIGTVQAYNSVLVRARVDGTVMRIPVKEGQEVKTGDLIAVIDPRPYQATLDQVTAKKVQDEALLANAKLDLTRFASLASQNFASRQQLDTQQATVAQTTAAIQGDQATIEAAQLNLAYCYITSPISGRVGLRIIDPGNLVHATDTAGIITIAQDHPITAVFTLPEQNLPDITSAMAGGAPQVIAFSSDRSKQLDTGTLLAPNNQVDISTGTIQLKAEFANANNTLWPGQFVNARLLLSVARNALTIPAAAIQRGPDGLYVFVIKPDSVAEMRPIGVGYQNADLAVVTKGLDAGESLVINGASRLDTGTRVAATQAAPAT